MRRVIGLGGSFQAGFVMLALLVRVQCRGIVTGGGKGRNPRLARQMLSSCRFLRTTGASARRFAVSSLFVVGDSFDLVRITKS